MILTLSGNFTGQAGITANGRMIEGGKFGEADAVGLAGLDNLIADNDPSLYAAYGEGDALVWKSLPTVDLTTPSEDKVFIGKPEFAGTATPGATVTVKLTHGEEEFTLTAIADENGDWSVMPDADLADGTYGIEVTATNQDGKTSTPESKNLIVDTTPPSVELTQPSGDKVFTGKPEFTGTATPGATVTVQITDEITLTATADENGSWSVAPDTDLQDDTYNIVITATKDGKTSTTVNKNLEIDTTVMVELEQPSGNTVFTGKPEFSGTATPGATVTVKITDEITLTATADENGSWSVAPDADLPDGSYNVEITASKDGRTSTPVSKNLVVDTTLPTVELDQPSGDKVFTGKPEFSGTATPGATVTVKITEEITLTATADENGSWNVAPDADLPDGSYNVEITASKDGKTSTPVSKNFTVENVDKTALKQKIDEIQGKITAGEWTDSDYTIESWANLSRALEEAVDVFNDPNAAQEAVDQALATLQQAELDLVKLNGELQELNLVGLTDDGEQAITLSPEFDPNQYNHYSGTVTSDVYGISINPSALYPNDTTVAVSLNDTEVPVGQWDNLPLRDGKNTIVVTVKDKNGELLNQYTIEIDRLAVIADNKLQSLVPSVGSLSPSFDPNRDSYTMSVANRVNQLQLTPTVFDSNAKIEIRGIDGSWQEVTSGNTSDYLALNVGSNTIIVKVTGQDGNVKEYTLTVTRASNSGGGIVIPWTPSESPEDIVSTVNDSSASFASGTATQTGTTVTVDPDKLSSILAGANEQKLAIHSPNEGNLQVDGLMADALKQMADTGTNLNISNPLAIYPIPSGKMDLGGVSKQLDDAALNDIAVHVAIARSSDALIESAKSNAIEQGYELLVTPVDLDLTFTKDGKTVKSEQLNGYAPKYIALPEGIDPNRITTGVIVNPDGSVYHVPTVVTKLDSRYYALINDLRSSGTYSVIWNPQDFDDVRSHWGREDINNIAARLDLQGNGDNTFSPNRIVTRSEFAEIVVLGLDLMNQDAPQTNFSDVPTSAWYKDSVAIADEFTIVEGYSDGHFRGDQQITREQGFAMIARAYRLVQSEGAPDQEQIALALDQYSDGADVSNWAKADVAQLIHAGIIQGNGPEVLSPKAQMTRAEVAALIARMLKVTDLIDK